MKMKSTYPLALLAVTGALFITSAPLRADETDNRIEASAKKSHVFKTYLRDDAIAVHSKDGAVTLKGSVAQSSHKSVNVNTGVGLPGVKLVAMKQKGRLHIHADQAVRVFGVEVKSA